MLLLSENLSPKTCVELSSKIIMIAIANTAVWYICKLLRE